MNSTGETKMFLEPVEEEISEKLKEVCLQNICRNGKEAATKEMSSINKSYEYLIDIYESCLLSYSSHTNTHSW